MLKRRWQPTALSKWPKYYYGSIDLCTFLKILDFSQNIGRAAGRMVIEGGEYLAVVDGSMTLVQV